MMYNITMFFTFTIAVLVICSTLSFASATSGDISFRNTVLETHNIYRNRHGVVPLAWDWALANHAQRWSNKCEYEHSDDQRPYNDNVGENISYGFPSMKSVIEDWYETEVDYYDFERGRSKNGVDILHLTQMIWKETTHVGCAETYCGNLNGYFYVCNYYPKGNWQRAYVQNVNPPVFADQ